ncbi:predicted protein [Chaetomium globosum CBS 148.51]|uniref:Uncharacterized protein n=1 Tax=Chaetomium globosum (strain ATCC 6205 / CBS 148.51 / DSM 1962 / NBRC 6347 / NRRL 1970) TaxID=306901 RepID=Q2GZV6_CHAGB|nr:uncharacterized protein CHGG_04940 [Chaetomium globosum CBS 148.51]EAQ88321.1 predicted protein [Chaetomium globosum CBS 148.51]
MPTQQPSFPTPPLPLLPRTPVDGLAVHLHLRANVTGDVVEVYRVDTVGEEDAEEVPQMDSMVVAAKAAPAETKNCAWACAQANLQGAGPAGANSLLVLQTPPLGHRRRQIPWYILPQHIAAVVGGDVGGESGLLAASSLYSPELRVFKVPERGG